MQQQQSVVWFLSVLLIITLSNLLFFRRPKKRELIATPPKTSILIPARNEENNIKTCIESLLLSDYPDFELLVLDDRSEDGTGEIVKGLSKLDDRVVLIEGKPLPHGWLGKPWACHQLATRATGEYLLFTDADTRHQPHALSHAISKMIGEEIDFLTLFPREEVVTWPEKLAVPIMGFSFLAIIPLVIAYNVRLPGLASANGQFMLFRKEAYEKVGGYKAIRSEVLDDFALAKNTKRMGLKWRFLDGTESLSCRMYKNFREVFNGFGKNLFSVFGCHSAIFLFIWFWMGFIFIAPPIIAVLGFSKIIVHDNLAWICVVNTALGLTLWTIALIRFKFPRHLILLYPLIVAMSICLALTSFTLAISGKTSWKGRSLIRPRIHWI